jgi:hypothetical protein
LNPLVSISLTILGVASIAAGLDLSHRWTGFAGNAASLLVPAGIIIAAAGAVSLAVPGFFAQ